MFLCGSAEPGRDGVGDYARRLAGSLQRRGVVVHLVATHDDAVTELLDEVQYDQGSGVPTLRIPATVGEPARATLMLEKIKEAGPEWISLQYVPYSFADSGIPWRFAATLRKIVGLAKVEIMFHELWLRNLPARDVKGRLTGLLQQWVTLRICRTLHPGVIHAHIPFNQEELASHGLDVRPLPLFANIGRMDGVIGEITQRSSNAYRIAFFSRMETPPPVLRVVRDAAAWCTENGRTLEVALLGGGKAKVSAAADSIESAVPAATVLPVGYLSPEGVSAWLATCDLAISPIPRHSLGKSGTVAAFLEHGLPVISPIVKLDRAPFFQAALNELVMEHFDAVAVGRAKAALNEGAPIFENLQKITDRFMDDLKLEVPRVSRVAERSTKSE
ncbi:glycosyltransferase involved in cell wall biosynthesis [Neolewinella xylanilytica]|uniref:Glycosyltransferase involved in cell wall biosynthesis n=1 Tax=Neolewinella xylanilytica TaxID=1514080 RepID=A0A2S6I7Q4_9BACT|nr:glycosyltransferase involved in cell wall biosynthesis [Neolewinella xylanilytica]